MPSYEVIGFEPEPFCDFCGRTASQVEEMDGINYIVVSQRNGHAAICTACVAAIVDAVIEKASDEGQLDGVER